MQQGNGMKCRIIDLFLQTNIVKRHDSVKIQQQDWCVSGVRARNSNFSSENRRGRDQNMDLQKRAKKVAVSHSRQEQKLY